MNQPKEFNRWRRQLAATMVPLADAGRR